jgi:hypothetical protein
MSDKWKREVVLPDLDGRGHQLRFLRDGRGEIYCEVTAKHDGTLMYSTLRLGESQHLIPQLAPLRV